MKPINLFILLMVCTQIVAFDKTECPIIGIDFGNAYSSVGVFQDGKIVIIPDEQRNRLVPSFVCIESNGTISVGAMARDQCSTNNTIYGFKRVLGRFYDDRVVQDYKKVMPLEIINDNNSPKVVINGDKGRQNYSFDKITSLLITKLKEMADTYLGCKVKDAVITIPAYFDNNQRAAMREAVKLAGLNVVRWLREPEAAAIAYKLDKVDEHRNHNTLVIHLDEATLDVTLMSFENGVFEVLANCNNIDFGENSFENVKLLDSVDQVLVDVFMNKTDVDHIVFSGGSTWIQEIRELVEKYFDGKKLGTGVELDLAVIYGAVIKAEAIEAAEQKSFMEKVIRTIVNTIFTGARVKDELF